jgi:CxxC motif-containing protein (DUF1111 family)
MVCVQFRGRTFSVLATVLVLGVFSLVAVVATEAPTGFSTPTLSQGPGSQSQGNGFITDADFTGVQAAFEESDGVDEGLGPVFNAQSCTNCHQNPVTGGGSQVSELRVGHRDSSGRFVNPTVVINNGRSSITGRSLINDRATCAEAQMRVPSSENLRTFRMSLSVLGDGFVEAIDSQTLLNIANGQRNQTGGRIAGQFIQVPVLEAPGNNRGGRFGWKNQHASLLSFAADAYLNEQGITNRLQPDDITDVCRPATSGVEDAENDIDEFADFMRATKAPPVDAVAAATPDAQAGSRLFGQIGCNICHVSSITTAAPGVVINGGTFTVPAALGNKIIHPYSDFLLHNVGTGDGIVQNGPQETANKFRTTPLWGFRTRDRLMHDGLTLTPHEAILRHAGEATFVVNNYRNLTQSQKNQILRFLGSL